MQINYFSLPYEVRFLIIADCENLPVLHQKAFCFPKDHSGICKNRVHSGRCQQVNGAKQTSLLAYEENRGKKE